MASLRAQFYSLLAAVVVMVLAVERIVRGPSFR